MAAVVVSPHVLGVVERAVGEPGEDVGVSCTGCSTPAPTASPAPTVTPAPTATVPLLACDFESNLRPACGFDYTADYDWTRHSGSTPHYGTGPSSDHTSGSGFYLYFDTRGDWPDYTEYYPNVGPFTLSSPSFAECVGEVRFFYHMYSYYATYYDWASGDNYQPGTLQLEETTDGVSWTTIWTKSGNHGDSWQSA